MKNLSSFLIFEVPPRWFALTRTLFVSCVHVGTEADRVVSAWYGTGGKRALRSSETRSLPAVSFDSAIRKACPGCVRMPPSMRRLTIALRPGNRRAKPAGERGLQRTVGRQVQRLTSGATHVRDLLACRTVELSLHPWENASSRRSRGQRRFRLHLSDGTAFL